MLVLAGAHGAAAQDSGLRDAFGRYPPLIIGANTNPVTGPVTVRACPAAGGVVEQKGGPTTEYLGASAASPDLCRMRIAGQVVDAWYGIWLTDWPGAGPGYAAIKHVMAHGIGAVEGFDVVMAPGYAFHDLVRNEGVESIRLLGTVYQAVKISHYREGFDGNTYRSVSTVWKDLPSGMIVYATYQHISGAPEVDSPLVPTRIAPQLQRE